MEWSSRIALALYYAQHAPKYGRVAIEGWWYQGILETSENNEGGYKIRYSLYKIILSTYMINLLTSYV